jgi:CheY-like chemotaxis protein
MNEPTATNPRTATVLIADDNSEARRMLEVRVKREGYAVLLAEDGRQALALLERQDVDMILLDIYMPEKDGFEVLAAVKNDPRWVHVPILMISGGGDQEDLVRCIEMGAVDYLSKPYNQALLRARLATCIADKRKRDEERGRQPHPPSAGRPAPALTSPAQTPTQLLSEGPTVDLKRPPLPQRVGRIQIQRPLGSGGMGHVFLGHHELLDLPVAVKLVRPELLNEPATRARVLREARMAARITHPSIVRLHEAGEYEDGLYLAFEYVDGGDLADLLQRSPNRRLEVATALGITRAVAAGLAEINRLGMTHRDITPRNLLLTQTGAVKIADLGLARQQGSPASPTLTSEHVISGTALYMSPEQVKSSTDLDIRSDLYSLGVVLFKMVTGRLPFEGSSSLEILWAHLNTAPPPPTQFRPDLPAWVEAVCLKLLAKERDQRYQTPEALLADLAEAPLSGEP